MARVLGSYPIGRRFESHCRYHKSREQIFCSRSLTARWSRGLRHRPFTAVTRVRVPYGSPHGGIAQLVERSPHTREVTDSSSVVSTKILKPYGFRIFFIASRNGKRKEYGIEKGKRKTLEPKFEGFKKWRNAIRCRRTFHLRWLRRFRRD